MNPAVTTGLASIKKCSLKHMASYVIAQYMGSFLAAGVVYLIYIGKFLKCLLYTHLHSFHKTIKYLRLFLNCTDTISGALIPYSKVMCIYFQRVLHCIQNIGS